MYCAKLTHTHTAFVSAQQPYVQQFMRPQCVQTSRCHDVEPHSSGMLARTQTHTHQNEIRIAHTHPTAHNPTAICSAILLFIRVWRVPFCASYAICCASAKVCWYVMLCNTRGIITSCSIASIRIVCERVCFDVMSVGLVGEIRSRKDKSSSTQETARVLPSVNMSILEIAQHIIRDQLMQHDIRHTAYIHTI